MMGRPAPGKSGGTPGKTGVLSPAAEGAGPGLKAVSLLDFAGHGWQITWDEGERGRRSRPQRM